MSVLNDYAMRVELARLQERSERRRGVLLRLVRNAALAIAALIVAIGFIDLWLRAAGA